MIKNLHHVGIVVKDLDETMKIYGGMLGAEPVSMMEIKEANLRKADFKVGGSMLEFFEGSPGSMFGEWLEKNGEGVHHIAYEVEDIEGELKKQAELGVKLVDKEPRVLPGSRIAFIGPEGASGVMIELVEPAKG
ncbi:MAG: VOC family protein [Dehalococcoidales bacterium]|nr:VOC family protein [Dehalococcoidales bacterium]